MKLKLFFNYFAIFILSTIVGSVLFYQNKSNFNKSNSKKNEQVSLELSHFFKLYLNDTALLTEVKPIQVSKQTILNQLQKTSENITDLISPFYKSVKSDYAYAFFIKKNQDIHFALFKKYPGHDQFQVIATYKVINYDSYHIQLPYGDIVSMSREEYFFENLKLAQATELEENL